MIVAIDNARPVGTTRFPIRRRVAALFHLIIERKEAAQRISRKWRNGENGVSGRRNPLRRLDSRKEKAWIFLPLAWIFLPLAWVFLPQGLEKPSTYSCGKTAHARQGKVQVSVSALAPARRKTLRSELWPGSTAMSMPARNPLMCVLGMRNVRRTRPAEAVATVCTSEASLM